MISHFLESPENLPHTSSFGPRDQACTHCGVLHFTGKIVKLHRLSFHTCCVRGQSGLQPLPDPPEYIRHLLTEDSPDCKHSRSRISNYNDAMAFTACFYTRDDRLQNTAGLRPFLIRGSLYHTYFPLEHAPGSIARYAQAYLYDPDAASGLRFAFATGNTVRQPILLGLVECL